MRKSGLKKNNIDYIESKTPVASFDDINTYFSDIEENVDYFLVVHIKIKKNMNIQWIGNILKNIIIPWSKDSAKVSMNIENTFYLYDKDKKLVFKRNYFISKEKIFKYKSEYLVDTTRQILIDLLYNIENEIINNFWMDIDREVC